MKKKGNKVLSKGQNKAAETDTKEMKIYERPGKKFKIILKKMFNELSKMMHEQNENIKRQHIKKKIFDLNSIKPELKNSIPEIRADLT